MIVGVCRVTLLVGDSHSLKEKRMVIRRIKDRVRNKFNVAIAEVGDQDLWQSAQLGFAVVSNEMGFTQAVVQKILNFIEDLSVAKVADDEQDYVSYGEEMQTAGKYDHWEPDETDGGPGRATDGEGSSDRMSGALSDPRSEAISDGGVDGTGDASLDAISDTISDNEPTRMVRRDRLRTPAGDEDDTRPKLRLDERPDDDDAR